MIDACLTLASKLLNEKVTYIYQYAYGGFKLRNQLGTNETYKTEFYLKASLLEILSITNDVHHTHSQPPFHQSTL